MSRSELPSKRAVSSAFQTIKPLSNRMNKLETRTDCVTLIRAVFTLPRDKCTEATTDAPKPNINPIPVLIRKSGATIFTAAKASLPNPRPTNIPSVITNKAEKTIPSTVGKSNFRKR